MLDRTEALAMIKASAPDHLYVHALETEAVMRAGIQVGETVLASFIRQKTRGFKPSWAKSWQAFRPG